VPDTVDLAIDAGQPGIRFGVARGGVLLRRAGAPGLTYDRAGGPAGILDRRAGPMQRLVTDDPVDSLCLGLTSVLRRDADYRALAEALRDRFRARRVLLCGDVVTAHAGALAMAPGVVLAAGTGAIALGVTADGRHRSVDGGGYLYGDAGGGFWIGRAGLDAALRGHDGRVEPGPLTARATEVFGDLAGLTERLYPADDRVAQVAGFARHVLDLAAGDPVAAAIVTAAADELAATTATAGADQPSGAGPGGESPGTASGDSVSWTGRLLRHEGLRRQFETALRRRRPSTRLSEPVGDGLDGAAALAAAAELGPYTGLVRVVTR
jgi:N-acetylglucosamine kinase-like BadF-type ATPase